MDLEKLRHQIDQIDRQIIELLAQRLAVVDQVGRYKKAHHLETRDSKRYQDLLAKLKRLAGEHNVTEELVEKIYHEIHEAAITRQDA